MTARRLVVDLDQIAALFSVSSKCVRDWISAGLPTEVLGKQGRGRKTQIDLRAAVDWYFRQDVERRELNRTRARLNRAMAENAELKAAASRGDLVSLAAIGREFGKLLAEIRTNALAIPSKLTPELEGLTTAPERYAAVEHVIHELLDHCARWRPGGGR